MKNTIRAVGSSALVRRRMSHAKAFQAEMKRWKLNLDQQALVSAFCACVAMKMKGRDMDDVLQSPNDLNSATSP